MGPERIGFPHEWSANQFALEKYILDEISIDTISHHQLGGYIKKVP